ncbi:hypothetical protein MXB_4245, partial [Myxobolus squamalis]
NEFKISESVIRKASKYIFITGGVISGLGKGVTTSFLGALMKAHGYNVTAVKIDPYINIDAGTFSPYEHGEVFVLDDGAEVDLDLGNYERMLDIRLSRANNITTGKVYDKVIKNERAVVPHVTDEIQSLLLGFSNLENVEHTLRDSSVGGVVGDIEGMPFLEAIRQLQYSLGRENYCQIHLSLVPMVLITLNTQTVDGEPKTKPTQMSVRNMRTIGLHPDFVISFPNMKNLYNLMPKLIEQNIVGRIYERLNLPPPIQTPVINQWLDLSQKLRCQNVTKKVVISIVGKYTLLIDAYHSIIASLSHSALFFDHKISINWVQSGHLDISCKESDKNAYHEAWEKLRSSQGIVIPGGFDNRGTQGKILAIQYARENNVPILGICLGLQLMIVEFARNVLYLDDADSVELNADTLNPVIIEMPEFNPSQKGGTMRLGLKKTIFSTKQSHACRLYGTPDFIFERHRHRYEFNINYKSKFEEAGMMFAGHDESGKRMEIIELPGMRIMCLFKENNHPYFVGVQYHPEFLSRPFSPAPLFKGLIMSSIERSISKN